MAPRKVQTDPSFLDDPFSDLPSIADVATEPPADEEETAPAVKTEPVELIGGTVEVSIPGSAWGHQYGAVRITVPAGQIADVNKWLVQNTRHIQKAFDVADDYKSEAHPPTVPTPRPATVPGGGYAAKVDVNTQAPAPSPVVPANGADANAIRGLAAGALAPSGDSEGLTQVQGKYGPVVFPTEAALPKQSFTELAVQQAAQVLQVPAEYLIAFDNRADLLNGTSFTDSPGAVKFSKNAPQSLVNSVLTRNGKPATLGWVSWSHREGSIVVKPTKDFKENVMTIATLIAGGAA